MTRTSMTSQRSNQENADLRPSIREEHYVSEPSRNGFSGYLKRLLARKKGRYDFPEQTSEISEHVNNGVAPPTGQTEQNSSERKDHADLDANTKLSQIAMLGTHDAGTYMFSAARAGNDSTNLGVKFPYPVKCQSLDLVQQADVGVRYFDIRVRKDKNGTYKFFHFVNTPGDALDEFGKLLNHASNDERNLYIFKLHFDESKNKIGEDAAEFITRATSEYESKLITREIAPNLGDVTIGESVDKGKNIALLAHHTTLKGRSQNMTWPYKNNVHTKWGKVPDGKLLSESIIDERFRENNQGKIRVTQTNMPFFTFGKFFGTGKFATRVKGLAKRDHDIVAHNIKRLVDRGFNPGVISVDYAGTDSSSTRLYYEIIQFINSRLKQKTPEASASTSEVLSQ